MNNPLAPFLIRIFGSDGAVVGAGFLVSEGLALTCAHVVAQAVAWDAYAAERPTDTIRFDFPLLAEDRKYTAKVSHWVPIRSVSNQQPTSNEDTALLEIELEPDAVLPRECRPAPLAKTDSAPDSKFHTFGFPKGSDRGVPAEGQAKVAIAGGCVVIEDTRTTGYAIKPGFSGAPVWSNDAVIGMIVCADQGPRAAYMIPSALLWSEVLKPALAPQSPRRNKNVPRHALPYLCDRSKQEMVLSRALREHLDERRQRPIVCLIHGDEKEDYTGFLQRLKMRVFPKHLKLEERGLAIKEEGMTAPSRVSAPADFWEPLSRALLGYSGGLPEEIRAAAAVHTEPLMLKLHLDTESFQHSGEQLFGHLFNFWQEWPRLTSGRVLINCVCLSYKRYENTGFFDFASRRYRKLNDQVRNWLERFDATAYPQVTGVALPELHAITRNEVLEWADDKEVRSACEIYKSSVEKLFQRPGLCNRAGHIHSEDLYPELINLLKAEP